jgi:hypothetical protein
MWQHFCLYIKVNFAQKAKVYLFNINCVGVDAHIDPPKRGVLGDAHIYRYKRNKQMFVHDIMNH